MNTFKEGELQYSYRIFENNFKYKKTNKKVVIIARPFVSKAGIKGQHKSFFGEKPPDSNNFFNVFVYKMTFDDYFDCHLLF